MSYFMVGAMVATALYTVHTTNEQASANQKIANNNATMADYAAKDAQVRGEEEVINVQRRAAALRSSQRVSAAAKGLDLSYGTTADLQDQTDFFAQADMATARTNAGREAWRYRAQAQDSRTQGSLAKSNADMQNVGTILGATGQVAGKWKSPSAKATA
jgi:hypothetical protein